MRLLKALNLDDLIFLDIETVAATDNLTPDNPLWQSWEYKMKHGREPLGGDDVAKSYKEQASLFAEFGKIVCITIGKIVNNQLKIKSYYDDNEQVILQDFTNGLNAIVASNKNTKLVGHAIKGFDVPWMVRRMLVHQIELPAMLDTAGKKPWELDNIIDTMELWKGTGFNGGSLIAISTVLGLSNPKDDIEGFQTTEVYYTEEHGLQRIARYCEKDVLTVANIVLRLRYEQPITIDTSVPIIAEKVGLMQEVFNTKTITKKQRQQLVETFSSLNEEEQVVAKELLNIVNQ